MELVSLLEGKKTYLVSLLMLLFSFLGYLLGEIPAGEASRIALEALAFAGLRAGVAKIL